MILLVFSTGSAFWDFLLNRPVMFIFGYAVMNLCILGFKGFWGFLPIRVDLSVGSFVTSKRNAYNSERLTRIVQWKFFGGNNLPNEVREEVLAKFGPSAIEKPRHYKEVSHNNHYQKTSKP